MEFELRRRPFCQITTWNVHKHWTHNFQQKHTEHTIPTHPHQKNVHLIIILIKCICVCKRSRSMGFEISMSGVMFWWLGVSFIILSILILLKVVWQTFRSWLRGVDKSIISLICRNTSVFRLYGFVDRFVLSIRRNSCHHSNIFADVFLVSNGCVQWHFYKVHNTIAKMYSFTTPFRYLASHRIFSVWWSCVCVAYLFCWLGCIVILMCALSDFWLSLIWTFYKLAIIFDICIYQKQRTKVIKTSISKRNRDS
jgi:hypothetical protein